MRHVMILSAAVFAIAAATSGAQAAQSGKSGRYCLTQNNVGSTTACYRSLAACNKAKTGNNDLCSPSARRTTTGAGMRY